jgi:hypothetical protein
MLQARDAAPYVPTPADVLWLRRAVEAEGKPRALVARALVNLHMLQRARGASQSLAASVRAYAQPVNARWFPDGDLFRAKVRTAAELERARTRETVHATRTSFSAETVRAVDDALRSGCASDVTDYAASNVDASGKYVARSAPAPGENRFWTRAAGWPGYVVDGAGGAALAPLAMVLVFGWFALRGKR